MTNRTDTLEWHPGSFTKNFGWGAKAKGLSELHSIIRIGFDNETADVSRYLFRQRVKKAGKIDYIPINFFLYNESRNGIDTVVADELVFNAINFRHSAYFDALALFAFNLSIAGQWKGSKPYQLRPALWAHYFVRNIIANEYNWDYRKINSNIIESFVLGDIRYRAKTARKLATNFNYLLQLGNLAAYKDKKVTRWWVDCLFLALDRILALRELENRSVNKSNYTDYLLTSGFHELAGRRSIDKDLAARHLIDLYIACGERGRFSREHVAELARTSMAQLQAYAANDPSPIVAVHASNPSIMKTLPRICAMLARYVAGYETMDSDVLEQFDVLQFVKEHLDKIIRNIGDRQPNMTAEEVMKLMRD